MSDDFMNDVSTAVDSGGISSPVSVPALVESARTAPVQEVKPAKTAAETVDSELTDFFDRNDTSKQEVDKKQKPFDDQTNARQKTLDTKNSTFGKGQEKLLDTFLNEDDKGNLINAQGDVIALAGKSRTYYEGMKNEARKQRKAAADLAVSNMQLAQQFKALYDEYKGIQSDATSPIQSIVKETGFSENEAGEAITLLRQYKADPIEAIKNLLTQAKMSGIDISKIGANISVDPAIIRNTVQSLLDERLKPLSDRAMQEDRQAAANAEAQNFLSSYPEAARFTKAIAEAKQQFPQMSLAEIWLRLRREIENRVPQNAPRSTMLRKNPQKPVKASKPKVTVPSREYSTMSFEDIKNSIIEDYK